MNTKQRISLLLLLILLMSTVKLQAQTNTTLTLKACIDYALENNTNLQKAKLDEQRLGYQTKAAKGAGLPQVNAKTQFMDNFALPKQILPGELAGLPGQNVEVAFGVRYNVNATVEASQLLYNKEYLEGLKALDATQRLYQLNTFKTKEDLVYSIAQTYLQAQITQKQKGILQANLNRLQQLVNMAEVQYANGIIKKIDVDQLKVNKTNLLSELQNLEIGYTQQLNALKYYMNMPMNQNIALTALQQNNQYPLQKELSLEQNTNLRLIQTQRILAKKEFNQIEAGYYPTVAAFANYGFQGQTNRFKFWGDEFSSFASGVWGINVQIPIFDGLQRQYQLQESRLKIRQMELGEKNVRLATQMEYANANEKLKQNKGLVNVQLQNMQLAENVYNITKLSYQEGVAPLTELLNSETSLKEAQTQYLTALLQLNLAELDYFKTSGQLAKIIEAEL